MDGEFSNDAAILLGAHIYRDHKALEVGDGPKNSVKAFRDYLVDDLGVPAENILNLFNNRSNHASQLEKIRRHLTALQGRTKKSVRCLFVYYSGHGVHDLESNAFALSIARTDSQFPIDSSLKARELANTLRLVAGNSCRFVILDCCYAELAGKEFHLFDPQSLGTDAAKAFSPDAPASPLNASIGPPTRGCSLLCASGLTLQKG